MLTVSPRKTKITLTDYSYRRDIENRVLMSQLSVFEVNVIHEILHHSLRFPIEHLAEALEISVEELIPVLDKLSVTKLFKRQHMTLIVDKEMRKYFEFQIEKFDEDFVPDLDFLQNVLGKVPIHVLPNWYAIPRSSDNIFASIIEKYFLTPKIYRQYLNELQFDDPVLDAIVRDVYHAPHFKIAASELIDKYRLTRERFEEYLLLLEYHFVCCLSYNKVGDYWQEFVTPFAEWLEFLLFEARTKPVPLKGKIEATYPTEFGFIKDLNTLLKACQSKKVLPKEVKGLVASTAAQQQMAVQKLIQVEFAIQTKTGRLAATAKGKAWLAKPVLDQMADLASDPLNTLSNAAEFGPLWSVRNLRLVKKSLRRLTPDEWVDVEQFLEGFISPIGDRGPITLTNRGKKWKYVLPTYSEKEKQFIRSVILEWLNELGIVATGMRQGRPCFYLTLLGNHFIH
jgi:hypothetical protein